MPTRGPLLVPAVSCCTAKLGQLCIGPVCLNGQLFDPAAGLRRLEGQSGKIGFPQVFRALGVTAGLREELGVEGGPGGGGALGTVGGVRPRYVSAHATA